MKFVIDDKIPFIRGVFEPHGEVVYLPGAAIGRNDVKDADCLLVRTRTRCNEQLLQGSGVKFIGTATIGFDHIDTHWCENQGITWTNAPGCNSGSVAQYITAVFFEIAGRNGFTLRDKTLGIIGAGHVGKKVERIGRLLGMKVLVNDPPRERTEGPEGFTGLHQLLAGSDIVTIHVPLNREGPDRTFHLAGREFLEAMKPGAALINSSRGEVINEADLLKCIEDTGARGNRKPGFLAMDVWEHEPEINRELLGYADIATPHIAGYSTDGKHNATRMIARSAFELFRFDFNPDVPLIGPLENNLALGINPSATDLAGYIRATYDLLADDRRLRESPESFEKLRNTYPVRREFGAYRADPFPTGETGRILEAFGFLK